MLLLRYFIVAFALCFLANCQEAQGNGAYENIVSHQYTHEVLLYPNSDMSTPLSLNVKIMREPEEHAQGLMFVRDLAQNNGMLFLFKGERERSFWMRNTYIPLDLLFIREDGSIHHIIENAEPHDERLLFSHGAVKAVLEVNAGYVRRHKIRVGGRVMLPGS